jgi:uncharacterized membrane protein
VAEIFSAGGAVVVVLVLMLAVALVLWGSITSMRGGARHTSTDPQRILKERLARGEIDAEEYHRLSELIASDGARYLPNG